MDSWQDSGSLSHKKIIMEKEVEKDYPEIIQGCKISRETANFIACLMILNDLYGHVETSLKDVYGDSQLETVIAAYDTKSGKLKDVICGFITDSIYDNVSLITLNKI